jgi:hypothetical protein
VNTFSYFLNRHAINVYSTIETKDILSNTGKFFCFQ